MHTHPNARLTPLSRERLLRRHMDHCEFLSALAAQAGISLRTAYKWLARYRCRGDTSLADRQGCGSSALDRWEGDEGSGPWKAAEPRTQDPGAAVRVGEAGRLDPCRHQVSDDNQVDGWRQSG
jgi:hypothetical protein